MLLSVYVSAPGCMRHLLRENKSTLPLKGFPKNSMMTSLALLHLLKAQNMQFLTTLLKQLISAFKDCFKAFLKPSEDMKSPGETSVMVLELCG